MFLPLYAWMVQVVNGAGTQDLIESFDLKSLRKGTVTDVFEVGDTLIADAKSKSATAYNLTVFDASSVILVENGEFSGSRANVKVVLNSPMFNAAKTYVLFLEAYAFNYPIPGAYSSDSVTSTFQVVGVQTNLGLETEYDREVGGLRLKASLSSDSGYAVANQTVDFSLRFDDRHRVTDGWLPLGTTVTDRHGRAELSLAFALPDGNYSFRARHLGDENFGESKNVTSERIVRDGALKELRASTSEQVLTGSADQSYGLYGGVLTVQVSNQTPYASLPFQANASYSADPTLLPWQYVYIGFFLDSWIPSGRLLSAVLASASGGAGGRIVYNASLVWNPDVLGSHKIITVAFDSFWINNNFTWVMHNGIYLAGLVTDLNIPPCPINIVLDFPNALYGSVLPVTTVVTEPRLYEVSSTEFYVSTALSPHFVYDGAEYAVDNGVASAQVNLYINDVLTSVKSTDSNGIAIFSLQNFLNVRLKVIVNASSLLSQTPLNASLPFRKVRVYDVPSTGTSSIQMNLTINGNKSPSGQLYTGVPYDLRVTTSLFNQSLWNVPVSYTAAKLVSSVNTDASGSASIPAGSDYVRVHNTTPLRGDANGDGVVDIGDMGYVNAHWGTTVGSAGYSPDADLNLDGVVDIADLGIVNANWGKQAYHLVFDSGQTVYVDSLGFAKIPAGAIKLTVVKESAVASAFVEFFKIAAENSSNTDRLGITSAHWTPSELGRYMIQAKPPQKFDTSTTFNTTIPGLDAPVNLAQYFDVVKRPIELAVQYSPSEPALDSTVTMIARVFDSGLGQAAQGLNVQFLIKDTSGNYVLMGSSSTNSSGVATFSWLPNNYFERFGFNADFALSVKVDETSSTMKAEQAPIDVDARIRTGIEFLDGEEKDVNVGDQFTLTAKFIRVDNGLPISGKGISLYKNNVKIGWAVTDANGIASWTSSVSAVGTYEYKAIFDSGDKYYSTSSSMSSLDGQIQRDYDNGYVDFYVDTTSSKAQAKYHKAASNIYSEWRMYDSFDTSQVHSTATVTAATLSMKAAGKNSPTDYQIYVDGGSQPIYGNALSSSAWGKGWTFQSSVWASQIAIGSYSNWPIQPSQINKGGKTQFEVTQDRISDSYVYFYTGEQGSSSWPVLSVVYSYATYATAEDTIAVVAGPPKTFVEFDVQPRDFQPPSPLTLSATVLRASTMQTFGGVKVNFYKNSSGGVNELIGYSYSGADGVATLPYTYSGTTSYSFKAEADGEITSSSGTMVTVGSPTSLDLTSWKDPSSFVHYVSGTLRSGSSGLRYQTINIYVNDTLTATATTIKGVEPEADGYFKTSLNLQPLNNQPTLYRISASYDGSLLGSATSYSIAPNGTQYAVSTTMQYIYEPVSNSAILLVEPQSTTATLPTQTPAQLQQQAKDKGWLTVYNEFSWSYPWYRLHFKIDVSDPITVDAGVSPLPSGSTMSCDGLQIFSQLNAAFVSSFVWEAGTLMTEYAAAKMAFWVAPWISAIFMLGEAAEDAIILGAQWNNRDTMLAFGIVNIIMGFVATQGEFAIAFLNLLTMVSTAVLAALVLITTGAIAAGGPSIANPVNALQVGLSFGLAAVALAHWAGWI